MQAYKFNTRVSDKGIISLPYEPELFNTEVEIIVLPKIKVRAESKEKYTTKDFLKEFSGCLKDLPQEDTDDLRYEYLKKKYQLFSEDVSEEDINEARYKYLTEKYK